MLKKFRFFISAPEIPLSEARTSQQAADQLTVLSPQVVSGAARYLCHLDNPEKHRYNPEDVKQLGGLVYDEIINSASDDLLTLYEIFDWIDANVCVSFRQFLIWWLRQVCAGRSGSSKWSVLQIELF